MVYNIFLASSMRHPCRESVPAIINVVNNKLEYIGVRFNLIAYGNTPVADIEGDTQRGLYHQVAMSDMLIVVVDNNTPMGAKTFGEYRAAYTQSKNNFGKPAIKVFALYDNLGDAINIEYIGEDGLTYDFEAAYYNDSKRYPQYLLKSRFESFFEEWLIKEALYGLENNLKQNDLSYADHLRMIGQAGIREFNERYYRRDKLDGEIKRIFESSPIIILEGNTYSGKTRAAFEFMKSCKEWEEYDFHIYDNRHSVRDLNDICRLDYSGMNRGDVFLFDDINEILNKNAGEIERGKRQSLWGKLNGYNDLKGFSLNDLGKTRIIFTVSGKLSGSQKNDLYNQIFNSTSVVFRSNLEKIIVDFDIYDQYSFRQMVNAMMRDGMLKKDLLRPGNYTIGSLFIRTDEIRNKVNDQYVKNSALMLVLVAHFKYATKSRFTGLINEIQELYQFISDTGIFNVKEDLETGIERLRREGLIVVINEQNRLHRIFLDRYILEIFNDVVIKNVEYAKTFGVNALNKILIEYAMECQHTRGTERDLIDNHICFVTQMAYLLIDRNQPDDVEIIDLIDIVASTLLNDKCVKKSKKAIIVRLVDIASLPDNYPMIFASSAIANIKDFELVDQLIDECWNYYRYCIENKDEKIKEKNKIAVELYKRAIYSMLSTGNRTMTMEEEQRILTRVLDNDDNWIAPFEDNDLHDVFNLARLTKHIKKMGPRQIISLLPEAELDGADMEDFDCENNTDQIDDSGFDDIISSSMTTVEKEKDGRYEKVFLKQLSNAVISALRRVNSFKEFQESICCLKETCNKSIHVERAITHFFVRDFYQIVPEITKKINYSDRTEFFDFIFSINDSKGVLDNVDIKDNVERLRTARIIALNRQLEYLDENVALEGYRRMIDNNLYDMESLSHLLKNESLNYEQVLRLMGKDDGQSNFITLNQLMGKAQTISDANVCMRLMGIVDCDPCKIRDEKAFANFLLIKDVDYRRCIEIVKGRRQYYPDALPEAVINIILNKFNINQLIDIFFPSDRDVVEGCYFEKYGFIDEEIEGMRKNAKHLSILFLRANGDSCGKKISEFIREKFEEIKGDDKLRLLISDPELNGNNGILSVYMKNRQLFRSYESVRRFFDELPKECKPRNVNHYIYGVFLWNIRNDYKEGKYNRLEAIQLLNKELESAYEELAKHYTKDEVVSMMASLYRYRPLLTDENNFNDIEEYVYEYQKLECTFKEYLEYLIENDNAYVDGTFIYNALTKMHKHIDNEVYEKLATLASLNHTGVKCETIFKTNKSEGYLSKEVQHKLFNVDSNTLNIDTRIVYNVSDIKVLWFLLDKKLMSFEDVEAYRKAKHIPITETYLNLALKHKQNSIKHFKEYKQDRAVFKNTFEQMIDYMKEVFRDASYIHKSIQMCLSLIAVAPNEDSLNQIFTHNGFDEFENKPEVIAARMTRLLQLRYKDKTAFLTLREFKNMILANCGVINIWIVNIYLSAYVKIAKKELLIENDDFIDYSPFKRCWSLLEKHRKINIFDILNLDDNRKRDVIEKLELQDDKWLLEANVQTFSYFAKWSPKLISTMDYLFDGNFTYDDSGKKNCLKDALKNYAFYYDIYKKDKISSQTEIECICKILLRKANRKIFVEICDEYIIKSTSGNGNKWNTINSLWKDLLCLEDFKVAFVNYFCNSGIKKIVDKWSEHNKPYLNKKDYKRIEILRTALCQDNLDNEQKKMVLKCYQDIKNNAEQSGNSELIKHIFSM